jgi:sirohydrochlorin ferrochelatase
VNDAAIKGSRRSLSGYRPLTALASVNPRRCTLRTAWLIIAHGSRQEEANADLQYVVASLRARGQVIVEAAFLELAEPDIATGGRYCVERGAQCVVLVPYFLAAGIHVRRDLAAARDQLAMCYPRVEFRLAEPLGRHRLLLDVVEARAREAGGGLS